MSFSVSPRSSAKEATESLWRKRKIREGICEQSDESGKRLKSKHIEPRAELLVDGTRPNYFLHLDSYFKRI